MGFDIVSNEPNPKKAEEFAKKYEYKYLFNKDTGAYEGDSSIYFRANIWGMGDIHRIVEMIHREVNQDLDYGLSVPLPILDKTQWNDGQLVTTADIKDFLDLVNFYTEAKQEAGNEAWLTQVRDNVYPIVMRMIKARRLDNPSVFRNTMVLQEDGTLVEREYSDEDAANFTANLFIEFVDYCNICLDTEGFRVY